MNEPAKDKTGSDTVFAGAVPEMYETLMVPLIFEPYALDLADRLAPRSPRRVLEIAAGTGVVTRRLAARLPAGATIVATDLNQAMLDHAASVGTARPVEWRQADAMQLPFPDRSFDAVVCQFGVMFFPDKAKAFAEARRVLAAGGVFLFNAWDRIEDNEIADTVTAALAVLYPADPRDLHMVFLISPGPGGGGGGGGLKQPAPPPPAAVKGVQKLRSPIPPVRRQPKPVQVVARNVTPPPRVDPPPVVKPQEPPPVAKAQAIPAVFAPVVPVAADPVDRAGTPSKSPPSPEPADSRGPGTGGGTGSGQGTGIGPGDGSGIGPGSGGGTGGGPYRPGAGISPPSILREVTPDYTDEGRRRAVQGDVVLEIVVRADGSVGSVKTLQGLGYGLDQRAADAVRQWRFNPARRYGTPVDVIVEVAVEFKLR